MSLLFVHLELILFCCYTGTPSKSFENFKIDIFVFIEQVTNPAFTSTPNLYDHDYGVVRQEVSLEEMLQAARKEIERLEQELDRKNNISQFGLRRFMYDDEMIRFYTGFSSSNVLWSFIDVIKPSAEKMRTWSQVQRGRAKKPGEGIINEVFINMKKQSLALEDQLFMWLCKVKLGLFDQDLAVRFNVSISTVSRMIITWSNFLYFTMGCLPLWSSRSQIRKTMPSSFKDSFSNVRVIIDCTEMKVQTPSSLVLHSEFYSSYKSATTFKGLVGITPSGAVSFISKLYTGSISDREIVKRCGILKLLEDGDGVMADKGFTIEDLLSPLNCSLNIPPFLSEKVQFSKEDVERTQKIAKLRIHVERAIRRVKENHLFDAVIPLSLASSINQIWSVCCMLSNFKGPLF